MTQGVDISYAQGNYVPGAFGEQFVIINASRANQGYLQVGSMYHAQVQNCRVKGKEVGHYFFNGNLDAVACADYFVNNLYDFRKGDTLWLDVEAEPSSGTTAATPAWALTFINRVKARTGVTPGVYLNQSLMNSHDWSAVVATGSRLWLAYYNPSLPAIRHWATAAVHQYTSTPIDLDRTPSGASLAVAGGGATTITEQKDDDDMGLPVAFVKDAKSASIYLVGPTGKRVGIKSPYHMGLLTRIVKNQANDPMLMAELDICATYLTAVGATPAAAPVVTNNVVLSDADKAAIVAALTAAVPHLFNINLTGKAEA